MNRLTRTLTSTAVLLAGLFAGGAQAADQLDRRIDNATEVVQTFTRIPENAIPEALLKEAYGIAVIPSVFKAGFGVGGRYGRGVLVVRRDDGNWSNPGFVSLAGGSLGWQIGAQSSDIILVFKSRKSVENIANGKFTLGGDAAVAAGPVGRLTSASTDLRLKAEIYSYSRNRGLFAGVSLEGAVLSMDRKSNARFYQHASGEPLDVMTASVSGAPAKAQRFTQVLAGATRPVQQVAAARPTKAPAETTRTYAID